MAHVDTEAAFLEEARRHGLNVPHVVSDGRLHRFPSDPTKPHDKAGWYVYHGDGIPSAAFGCWRSGVTATWCAVSDREMTADQREEHRRRVELAKAATEAEQGKVRAACRERSAKLWDAAPPAVSHPYLLAKGVKAHGVRLHGDILLVPVRGIDGTLHGLQKIDPTGRKLFEAGTRKTGSMHIVGFPNRADHLLVCEGYATGASLHEATGLPVVVAFDAGNLSPASRAIRSAYPEHRITICADDDHMTVGNPGRASAEEAARAIGGTVAVPTFPEGRGPKDTDFNDLLMLTDSQAVKRQVEAAFKPPFAQAPVDLAEVDMVRAEEGSASTEERPPLFVPIEALLANPPRPRWLVKRLIETPATVLLFGESGAGKSFVAVDLAAKVAAGGTWAGRDVASVGPVFYLAGEGRIGLLRRFDAWKKRNGVASLDRLYLSTGRMELHERGAAEVKEGIDLLAAKVGPPALIVVDTMARALPSEADENSAKDVNAFVNVVDGIRDRFNCVAVIVHHTGHGEAKRARGSSALKAGMDTEIHVAKRNGGRVVEWTKQKDGEEPPPDAFRIETVGLGLDDDHMVVNSAVVRWEGATSYAEISQTTPLEDLGIETLRQAVATAGGRPVTVDEWRPVFNGRHTGDNHKTKATAFRRVRESLTLKRLVRVADERYSLLAGEENAA